MSDYLTTLALRALAPPRSIWPRPAAHFESPTAFARPIGESSRAPTATPTGPASPEPTPAGHPLRTAGGQETGEATDSTVGLRSESRVVVRRREPQPGAPRRADAGEVHGAMARNGHAREPGTVSDDAAGPERVDHGSIATPVPEGAAPILPIERIEPPAERSHDDADAVPVVGGQLDDPVYDGDEAPAPSVVVGTSAPAPRPATRSRRGRARAQRDDGPHITVTIGRVEVTSPEQPPLTDAGIQRPALGLADYLKDRGRS